jgi:hypothetical protein
LPALQPGRGEALRQSRIANSAALKHVQKPWVRAAFFLHSLLTGRKPRSLGFVRRLEAMSAAAIFGAALSCMFVVALWFNYHGAVPSQDNSEQTDKTEQTDEKSKDKSGQQEKSDEKEKPEQKGKSSTKKAAKKKADVCVENCEKEWPLRSLTPWPNDELRR